MEDDVKDRTRKYLSGVTWNVYLYILTSNEPVGVRDVWRSLNLSSPSLAQYHINKLLGASLIAQTLDGKYITEEKAKIDVLRNFVLLRGRLVSRMIFYGAFLLGFFILYLIMYLFIWRFRWDLRDFVVSIVCIFSVAIFFFEAYIQHRGLRADTHFRYR